MSHNISIKVGDKVIERWQSYDINSDMLSPSDGFSMSLAPVSPELLAAVPLNAEIDVFVDGTQILRGFIEERNTTGSKGSGTVLEIAGKDRAGRLVAETMPPRSFKSMGLIEILEECAAPWFDFIILSNAENRVALRGGRRKGIARGSSRNTGTNKRLEKREVEAGEKRWECMSRFIKEAGLMCWSSADGEALIVAQPDYRQDPQFLFYAPDTSGPATSEIVGNVTSWAHRQNITEEYSTIDVLATGRGDSASYGRALRSAGRATSSRDFWGANPKYLAITGSEARNTEAARVFANDEMARREGAGERLSITVSGHSQRLFRGAEPAIYAFDSVAHVRIDKAGINGKWLIVGVNFTISKEGGALTNVELVPEGAKLSQ